jgi:crotonobetainyl-CoA:carnitine CoA-transferase CaiB-like acyl-CoA transferase
MHPASEGYIYLSANTPHFWQALCEKTGLQEFANDPRYDTVRKRAANADEILAKLHNALKAHTALEWEKIFGDSVPCAAARSIGEMFDHPQVLAEEMIATLDHTVIGKYQSFTRAIKFSRTPGPAPFAAPALGEHSTTLLQECGYTPAQVAELRVKGVVSQA